MKSFEDEAKIVAATGCAYVLGFTITDDAGAVPSGFASWEFEAKAGTKGGTIKAFALSDRNNAAATFTLTMAATDVDALYAATPNGCAWQVRYRVSNVSEWQPLQPSAPFVFAESLF